MEDFTPKGNEDLGNGHGEELSVARERPALQDPQVQATIQLAKVVANPIFMHLMQLASLYLQTRQTVKELNTEQDYENALDLFGKTKASIKKLEELRKEVVAFPQAFVKLVNDTFRPTKQNFEVVKQHFSTLISRYDARKRAEAAKAQAEAEARQEETGPQEQVREDGTGVVKMDAATVEAPKTTQQAGAGQTVQMRTMLEMEIVEPEKLLKAILSTAKRNEVYDLTLVSFNEPAIRKLCTGKRKIPGVKWETVKKAV